MVVEVAKGVHKACQIYTDTQWEAFTGDLRSPRAKTGSMVGRVLNQSAWNRVV